MKIIKFNNASWSQETSGSLSVAAAVVGIVVDDKPCDHQTRTLADDAFYQEFMERHSSMDFTLEAAGGTDEFRITAAEAGIFSIKAFIVNVNARYQIKDGDGEGSALLDEDLLIPVRESFGLTSGSYRGFLADRGVLAIANRLRVLEIARADLLEKVGAKLRQELDNGYKVAASTPDAEGRKTSYMETLGKNTETAVFEKNVIEECFKSTQGLIIKGMLPQKTLAEIYAAKLDGIKAVNSMLDAAKPSVNQSTIDEVRSLEEKARVVSHGRDLVQFTIDGIQCVAQRFIAEIFADEQKSIDFASIEYHKDAYLSMIPNTMHADIMINLSTQVKPEQWLHVAKIISRKKLPFGLFGVGAEVRRVEIHQMNRVLARVADGELVKGSVRPITDFYADATPEQINLIKLS